MKFRIGVNANILCAGLIYILALGVSRSSTQSFIQMFSNPSLDHLIYLVTSKAFLVGLISCFAFLWLSSEAKRKQAETKLQQREREAKYPAKKETTVESNSLTL